MKTLKLAVVAAVVAGLVTVASPGPAQAVPVAVDAPVTIQDDANTELRASALGDMDGDGDLDLVTGYSNASVVAWHASGGDGTTWGATTTIDPAAGGTVSVGVGDFDADGELDVVSSGSTADRVRVHLNDGAGATFTDDDVDTNLDGVADTAVGDIDGDGDVDLLAVGFGNLELNWYENDGTGTGWAEDNIAATLTSPNSVALADVDGDGDLDAFEGSNNSARFAWYENTAGDGSAWTDHVIPVVMNSTFQLAVGDIDDDADIDLFAISQGAAHEGRWYENTAGTGLAWTEHAVFTGITFPYDPAIVDFDQDGDADLRFNAAVDGDVRWLDSDGAADPSFTLRTVADGGGTAFSTVSGDLDSDGDGDAIVGSDRASFAENQTIHSTLATPVPADITTATDGATGVAVADLDGDGDDDIAVTSAFADSLTWLESNGADPPTFAAPVVIDATLNGAQKVVAADLDGDGDQDLAATAFDDDTAEWFENDGAANPTFAAGAPLGAQPLNGPTEIVAADLEGDGDMDLATTSNISGDIVRHINTAGDGSAWTSADVGNGTGAIGLGVSDLDLDGDLDLTWGDATTDQLSWGPNDGASPPLFGGGFAVVLTPTDTPGPIVSVDVDRDGDQDVVSGAIGTDTIEWHSNDGTPGNGGWVTTTIGTVDNPQAVEAIDFDQDGDLDVMATALTDRIVWFENSAGDGSAWIERYSNTASDGPDDLAFGDLDRDGDLDVVVPSTFDDTVTWIETELYQLAAVPVSTAPAASTASTEDDLFSFTSTHLGIAADHDAEVTSLVIRLEEAAADPLTQVQAEATIDELNVYRENGGAGFAGTETQVASLTTLAVNGAGDLTVPIDDVAGAVVPFGTIATFYVTAQWSASPSTVLFTFRTTGSAGEDDEAAAAIPLRVRPGINVSATVTGTAPAGGGGAPDPTTTTTTTAPQPPTVIRMAGDDRYETAAEMSSDLEPGVSVAYVATGEDHADALATGPVAGLDEAALLLVTHDEIPDATRAELARLDPDRIVVVGGTGAISDDVAAELDELTTGPVSRIAGDDRYATAVQLSAETFPDGAPVVHLVDGRSFADAIAAGPAAGTEAGPILLVDGDTIPAVTAAELVRLAPSRVVLAGGSSAIGSGVADAIAALLPEAEIVDRAGVTRYGTAAALADPYVDGTTEVIYVATGETFADALTATPTALRAGAVILLVPSDGELPQAVLDVLAQAPDADVILIGGTGAVSDEVMAQLR